MCIYGRITSATEQGDDAAACRILKHDRHSYFVSSLVPISNESPERNIDCIFNYA